MKLFAHISTARRERQRSAFTLVEMMISSGIYLGIFIGALVSMQIFALRVYTLAATKLTATQASRKSLNQIRDDIRQGKGVQVGNSDNLGNFTAYAGTNLAVGNAIQIYATTNGNFTLPPYSIYYLQTNTLPVTGDPVGISSNVLMWVAVTTNSTITTPLTLYVTNLDVFSAQDCWGNTISNCLANNQVFTVKLQYYQWEYPIAMISSNVAANAYDYYQLRTRVCRRALN